MFRQSETGNNLLIIEPTVTSSSLTQMIAGAEARPCRNAGRNKPVSVP